MPRFFLPELDLPEEKIPSEEIFLRGEEAFHLSVSLRSRIGDEVILCNARGMEFLCRISSISGGKKDPVVALECVSVRQGESEPEVFVTLFQGMPKGKKTDSILQKCTELGVSKVVFVYSDHCVPTWDGEDKKNARYERIVLEAAKQCGRGKLVQVDVAKNLESAMEEMKKSDLSFACYEKESEKSLKELLSNKNYRSISFFIGPEGGISPREAELLEQNKIPTVTLGKRILRTETAASAVLSMILYENEL